MTAPAYAGPPSVPSGRTSTIDLDAGWHYRASTASDPGVDLGGRVTGSWDALGEIGGTPTTRATAGFEERAAGVQTLVRDAHRYLAVELGTDFAPLVVVADPTDWARAGDEVPPYGIPYASDDEFTLVVPAEADGNFLVDIYADGGGSRASATRFADLIAVHELGHLHVRAMGLDLPMGWLGEFLATYLACCFLSARQPEDASLWYDLSCRTAGAGTPEHHSLETLDELYFDVGPENYIWYQNQLTMMVERVHAARGIGFALSLRSAGLGPTSSGPAMLAAADAIHPGFAEWAASL